MKLRLLSLIAIVATAGLNAEYYLGGKEAFDRPMEKVGMGTYGQGYEPKNLGGELSVDPKTGEYYHFVGDWKSETPRFGNFLTPVD